MTGINAWATANLGALVMLLGVVSVVSVVALVLAVWLALRLRETQRHYSALTRGTNGGNLDEVMESHAEAVRDATRRIAELTARTQRVEVASVNHLQCLGFLRFNPFRDAGGDQSFALALADRDGNGVIISSLHGRDGTRIYGKPLATWTSVHPLTDEERQAIEKAKMPANAMSTET